MPKAISIQQPWAWAILHAGKNVENRTWSPPELYYGSLRLVVHAGKKIDQASWAWFSHNGIMVPNRELHTGCLLGEITVTGCRYCHDPVTANAALGPWASGPWCWLLADPVAYDEPIPYRGQLRIFEVEI